MEKNTKPNQLVKLQGDEFIISITRQLSPGKRKYDDDNFISGCKSLRDAVTEICGLKSDSHKYVKFVYLQERNPTIEKPRILISIYNECGPALKFNFQSGVDIPTANSLNSLHWSDKAKIRKNWNILIARALSRIDANYFRKTQYAHIFIMKSRAAGCNSLKTLGAGKAAKKVSEILNL